MRHHRFMFLSDRVNDVSGRIEAICCKVPATFSWINLTVLAGRVEERAHSRDAR